jgi:hypothetical protein
LLPTSQKNQKTYQQGVVLIVTIDTKQSIPIPYPDDVAAQPRMLGCQSRWPYPWFFGCALILLIGQQCGNPSSEDESGRIHTVRPVACETPASSSLVYGVVLELFDRTGMCVYFDEREAVYLADQRRYSYSTFWNGVLDNGDTASTGAYTLKTTIYRNGQAESQCTMILVDNHDSVLSSPPVNFTVVPGDKSAALQWNHVKGALGYTVVYASGDTIGHNAAMVQTYDSILVIENLVGGLTYSFCVSAYNSGGNSPSTDTVSATLPPATPGPTSGLSATPANRSVLLKWDPIPHVSAYQVFWADSGDFDSATAMRVTVQSCAYTLDGLVNGRTYEVAVVAKNIEGISSFGDIVSITPLLPCPLEIFARQAGDTVVNVRWDPVENATGYTVTVDTASGDPLSSIVFESMTNSCNVHGFARSLVAAVGVSARDGKAQCEYPSSADLVFLTPPEGVSMASGDSSLTVQWNPVPLNAWYEVFYALGPAVDTNAMRIAVQKGVQQQIGGLLNTRTYTIAIRAISSKTVDSVPCAVSPLSSPVSMVPMPPTPFIGTGWYYKKIPLNWAAVPHVDYYTVYYAVDTVLPGVATSYRTNLLSDTIEGLDPDKNYQIALSYTLNGMESVLRYSMPLRPCMDSQLGSTKVVSDSVTRIITWDNVPGADAYSVRLEAHVFGLARSAITIEDATSPCTVSVEKAEWDIFIEATSKDCLTFEQGIGRY